MSTRTTKIVSISLPPEQYRRAERLAKKQSRTMSELFREGLRRMEQDERRKPSQAALEDLGTVVRLIQASAKAAGLDKMTKHEINAEVEAVRKGRMRKVPRPRLRSSK
ncbi:MAG TPA: ribbon-helix-helix protein, CopG family [Terriglobales bacterium]|nr:ribbon-helix-helix protein, CopG family [Terriglobales bacterium]